MSNGTITKLTNATVALGATMTQPTLELLTAMGHGNGSGATEEFTIVPGRPHLLRAKNFGNASDSDETKINAAITQALSLIALTGDPYGVLVDADMLPYGVSLTAADSSHVLHRPTVHMYREGGSLSSDQYDVIAYGANWTGAQNTDVPIQAAADVQAANGYGEVYFPKGTYPILRPIWFSSPNPIVRGAGIYFTQIRTGFGAGPIFLFHCSSTFPTAASLATGAGYSYDETGDANDFLTFTDSPTLDIDGLSAFTAELFVNPTTLTAGTPHQIVGAGATSKPSFRLYVDGTTGTVSFRLTISDTTYTISGGTLSVGTSTHVAGCFDGSSMYLFVGGTLAASAAHAGTITQAPLEEVVAGPDITNPAGGRSAFHNFLGKRDSIHFSNSCRYTPASPPAPPTAKFSKDAHTLLLCNFDLQVGPMTRAHSVSGDAWLYRRGSAAAQMAFTAVRDLTLTCLSGTSGIFHFNGVDTYYHRVQITSPRVGMILSENSNNGEFDYVKIVAAQRRALYMGTTSGVTQWNSLTLLNCGLCGLQTDSSGGAFINCFFLISSTTLNCVRVGNGSENVVFVAGSLSTEGIATPPSLESMIRVEGGTRLYGTVLETPGTSPHFSRSGNVALLVDGVRLIGSPSTYMTQTTPGTTPAVFRALVAWNSAIPLSDVPGTAIIEGLAGGPAVAYSASPSFDCGLAQEFELNASLSGDLTPTFIHMTPQQTISLLVAQNGGGGHNVTFGAEVKASTAVDTTASHWSLWTWKVGLDGKLYQKSFTSGA